MLEIVYSCRRNKLFVVPFVCSMSGSCTLLFTHALCSPIALCLCIAPDHVWAQPVLAENRRRLAVRDVVAGEETRSLGGQANVGFLLECLERFLTRSGTRDLLAQGFKTCVHIVIGSVWCMCPCVLCMCVCVFLARISTAKIGGRRRASPWSSPATTSPSSSWPKQVGCHVCDCDHPTS